MVDSDLRAGSVVFLGPHDNHGTRFIIVLDPEKRLYLYGAEVVLSPLFRSIYERYRERGWGWQI